VIPPRTHRRNRIPAQVAIWAVLLVLSLGVQRLFVVCTGAQCTSRVELAHATGSCGAHAHGCCAGHEETKVRDEADPGERAAPGHGHCVDVALGIAIGPLPKAVHLDAGSPPCRALAPAFHQPDRNVATDAVRPPTTGPPRTDQRTGLLASTLLLL